MRKRIAVLVAQLDESTQTRLVTSFIEEAYKHDYDVCVFTMYQKYQETALRDIGDSNIFELVNYALFDAILIMVDTILSPGVADHLLEYIHENYKGPVLVVDQESPYFASVKIDHYRPVRNIIDHLIEVHGYEKIAFLGGKEGHPHSVQRLKAYRDSMEKHHLPVKEEWIFHGNYWYDSGEEVAEFLLNNKEGLPQALACANDYMAIGAASRLSEHGIRIPEDIAITGYDSQEFGRFSPKPLTSADIPAGACGTYCMKWIDAVCKGEKQPDFEWEDAIFIGGSCGCIYETEMVPKKLRSKWRTQQSARSMFSDVGRISEDLMSQTTLTGFLQVVKDYVFQIKPFYRFDICLNDGFLDPGAFVAEKAIRRGYADTIYSVFSSGETVEGEEIDFDRKFSVDLMTPMLYEERDYPTTFIFNPFFFSDKCFGYSVLNYGREIQLYNESYRLWMRSIMQCMEAFYRQGYMQALVERIRASQIRDELTGLYNYEGFIQKSKEVVDKSAALNRKTGIMTIDIKGITQLNEIYGRQAGERTICALAGMLNRCTKEDEVCCRMCNDEFLIAFADDELGLRGEQLKQKLRECMLEYRVHPTSEYRLQAHFESIQGEPKHRSEMEALINQVVAIKNHKKSNQIPKSGVETKDLMDEIKRNQLVMHILNHNLLCYYYQPIVKVSDGKIYAYEALMRYEQEKLSPFQIIQAATYLKRLRDIEKATLLNVTSDVEENIDLFGTAKVFINSLPGVELEEMDEKIFTERLMKYRGRFVVEFTEESELDDMQLENLKAKYAQLGNEIAIDDYGAGYSNINNLLRYMPDYVKIDRMLIANIHEHPQKKHFVKSIIDFAHDNNILALAEGVETSEELRECIGLGVDLIQGFYTGKPSRTPVGEIDSKIRNEIARYRVWRPSRNRTE